MNNETEKPVNCITENCDQPAKWKGLCGSCYHQARALINDGKTTWEKLHDMGLVTIPDKPFTAAYKKKLAEMSAPRAV